MKIYTRTGDKGMTSLYSGERRPKSDAVFVALGDVDELNSALGVAREFCLDDARLASFAEATALIQHQLLDLGAAIATPRSSASDRKAALTKFAGRELSINFEYDIDQMEETLPPLKTFILPGGGKAAAHFHVARTTCRRAERSIQPLVEVGDVDGEVLVYVNRLSDWLFAAARSCSVAIGAAENEWTPFSMDEA
jgi:ATP:cob(I)alamin adenosyltransferase